jgi:hypothetical protein
MRQRRDGHFAFAILNRCGARQTILSVDVHRAGSANAFAAGPAEGERTVLLPLHLDQGVEDHRTAIVGINLKRVVAWIFTAVGVVAIDLEFLYFTRGAGCMHPAFLDLTVFG